MYDIFFEVPIVCAALNKHCHRSCGTHKDFVFEMPTDRADGDNDGGDQGFSTDTRRVLWIVRYSGTNLVYLEGSSNLKNVRTA